MQILIVLFFLLFPIVAFAQVPGDDISSILIFMAQAFQGGDWFVVGALVVLITVWVAARFVKNRELLPILSAAVGMLYSLALSFSQKDKSWFAALYFGLLASGPASLFWSMVGKKYLPDLKERADEKKAKKEGEEPPKIPPPLPSPVEEKTVIVHPEDLRKGL
jgi:hypothetical protein